MLDCEFVCLWVLGVCPEIFTIGEGSLCLCFRSATEYGSGALDH